MFPSAQPDVKMADLDLIFVGSTVALFANILFDLYCCLQFRLKLHMPLVSCACARRDMNEESEPGFLLFIMSVLSAEPTRRANDLRWRIVWQRIIIALGLTYKKLPKISIFQ